MAHSYLTSAVLGLHFPESNLELSGFTTKYIPKSPRNSSELSDGYSMDSTIIFIATQKYTVPYYGLHRGVSTTPVALNPASLFFFLGAGEKESLVSTVHAPVFPKKSGNQDITLIFPLRNRHN